MTPCGLDKSVNARSCIRLQEGQRGYEEGAVPPMALRDPLRGAPDIPGARAIRSPQCKKTLQPQGVPGKTRASPCSRGASASTMVEDLDKWSLQDSNLRHLRCERSALPAELSDRNTPTGTRTPVFAVRGRYPRPLDDGGMTIPPDESGRAPNLPGVGGVSTPRVLTRGRGGGRRMRCSWIPRRAEGFTGPVLVGFPSADLA
jgi:hypothetical protein